MGVEIAFLVLRVEVEKKQRHCFGSKEGNDSRAAPLSATLGGPPNLSHATSSGNDGSGLWIPGNLGYEFIQFVRGPMFRGTCCEMASLHNGQQPVHASSIHH